MKSQVDEMIDALDPEGLKIFAMASSDQLEALREGVVRYVSEKSGVTTPVREEVFRAFVKKAREVWLKSKIH